jgi:hypothetical protein
MLSLHRVSIQGRLFTFTFLASFLSDHSSVISFLICHSNFFFPFFQVRLMAAQDPTREHTWDLLSRVRKFAKSGSRRGFVLCNAHVFEAGWSYQGVLLMDFHAFPSRPRDVLGRPQEAVLKLECDSTVCVPYQRSAGGVTVGGYNVSSLPYLVELDNWGESSTPGKHVPNSAWTWGQDEITWFARLTASYRHSWLRYVVGWLQGMDPGVGFFEMPGLRPLANGSWYYAPRWAGDVDAIKGAWNSSKW